MIANSKQVRRKATVMTIAKKESKASYSRTRSRVEKTNARIMLTMTSFSLEGVEQTDQSPKARNKSTIVSSRMSIWPFRKAA